MFRINQLVIGLAFLAFSCDSDTDPAPLQYVDEDFPNLTLADVENVETPFSSTFNSGGRVREVAMTANEVIDKLNSLFPEAVIIEIERQTERSLPVWQAKIKMPSGGIIKMKVVEQLGKIIKMKGRSGPFNYNFNPEGSFITFSAAKELALSTVDGDIKSWSLELEEGNEWEYEFHIVAGDRRVEIEIKGFNEEVISVKEKQEGEDEDNDGEEDDGEKEDEKEHGDDNNDHVAPTDAVGNFVKEIFEGAIVHSERHEFEGLVYWEVYVKNEAGAVIKIKLREEPLTLVKIAGEVGPFDYVVEPGSDLLTFAAALEVAFSEAEGEVVRWKLDYELEDNGARWVYEFDVRSETKRYDIEIDAITGEITELKESDN